MYKVIEFNYKGKWQKIAQYLGIWIKNMYKRKNIHGCVQLI
jgi:hypothetical protein